MRRERERERERARRLKLLMQSMNGSVSELENLYNAPSLIFWFGKKNPQHWDLLDLSLMAGCLRLRCLEAFLSENESMRQISSV